jgi:antitoxin MazE
MRETKVVQIGNSRGVRIPKQLLHKYNLHDTVILEEHPHGILIQAKEPKKLSWEETYKEMAKAKEDWSDWERLEDGWETLD